MTKDNKQIQDENKTQSTEIVNRLEVIDRFGRAFVNTNCRIELSYQDEGKTLKIFVT